MQFLHTAIRTFLFGTLFLSSFWGRAQSTAPPRLQLKDFTIYATGTRSTADPRSVIIRRSAYLPLSGYIGGRQTIFIDSGNQIRSTIFSESNVDLFYNNQILGDVWAGGTPPNVTNAVRAGMNHRFGTEAGVTGAIFANGNVEIGANSTVNAPVHLTPGHTYTGPAPLSGPPQVGPISFPVLPELPLPSEITIPSTLDVLTVNSSQTLPPGTYGDLRISSPSNTSLTTLTLNGPGTYIFRSIENTTSGTQVVAFNFTFPQNGEGIYRILVAENAYFGKSLIYFDGIEPGGAEAKASQVYLETQGTGSAAHPGLAFVMEGGGTNGPPTNGVNSRWLGTVYAPNGSIELGDGVLGTGALWSAHSVSIGRGEFMHVALRSDDVPIDPGYPAPPTGKVDTENNVIGSELLSLHAIGGDISAIPDNKIFRINTATNKVLIEVVAQSTSHYTTLLAYLGTQGFETVSSVPDKLTFTGWFPIANLPNLNLRSDIINHVYPMFEPINNVGAVTSQGDVTMRSNAVRSQFGVTGAGVKVGILSDSYNNRLGASLDRAQGDLPALPEALQVARDFLAGTRTDEGRAMMQIVHDVAPDAHQVFRTGIISPLDFSLGITQLATEYNCDVIVDDITYITEPFFKDGLLAQTVADVVANHNVTYITSAGNFGSRSYEASFNGASSIPLPAGISAGGVAHNFGSGIFQRMLLKPGTYTIVLQWEDDFYSLGGSGNEGARIDMDFYLFNPNTGSLLFGFNRNNLGGNPIEVMPFVVSADTYADLLIVKATGSVSPSSRFKYIIFRGEATIEGSAGASTIIGHANANEAISVGAMLYANVNNVVPDYPSVASFSSRGGTIVTGESIPRPKPDMVGPNGVNTTVPLNGINIEGPSDVFPNFFGTSASAPHIAGVAALLIEAKRRLVQQPVVTPTEIKTLLKATAQDLHAPGVDYESGAGAVLADEAMLTMANAKPMFISMEKPAGLTTASTNFQITVRGRYLNPQTKLYVGSTIVDPVLTNSEEATATINVSVSTDPPIRLYNPPRTVSGEDGGFSAPLFLFSKVKNVVVKAADRTKKFGEPVPPFTANVTIDGAPATPAELAELRLEPTNLRFTTLAAAMSDVANYSITPSQIEQLDPAAHADLLLRNNITFETGTLVVQKLPVKITPNNQTLIAGDYLGGVTFQYDFGSFHPVQQAIDLAGTHHRRYLADNTLAVISGFNAAMPALGPADLDNMGMMTSFQSVRNARRFLLQNNGKLQPLTTNISSSQFDKQRFYVDVAAQSLNRYKSDPSSIVLVNAPPQNRPRGLINARSLAVGTSTASLENGQVKAMVNGEVLATINGSYAPVMNGLLQTLVNGQVKAMVNGELMVLIDGQLVPTTSVEVMENGQVKAMVNGSYITLENGQLITLVNGQVKAMVNGELMAVVNGELTFALVEDGQIKILVDGQIVPLTNGQVKAMVNGELMAVDNIEVLSNGQVKAMVNGEEVTLLNGQVKAMVNGQVKAMVNNDYELSASNNSNAAVIIDKDDVELQTGAIGAMLSLNMITGLEAGMQKLVPGAFFHRNFEVSYGPANVSILPANGAKKIIVQRECVRKLTPSEVAANGAGYTYEAVFSYTNNNAIPYYVLRGPNNRVVLSQGGYFENTLPEVFQPGTHTVKVLFSGHQMYWEVRSVNSTHKTAITAANNAGTCNKTSSVAEQAGLAREAELPVATSDVVYPNPAKDKLIVNTRNEILSLQDITVFDANGRMYSLAMSRKSGTVIEVNVSTLKAGVYLLKMKVSNGYKTIRFVKL